MQFRFVAMPCVSILLAASAQAQTAQPAPAPVAVAANSALATTPAVLRNGTPVPLRLLETLTTQGKNLRAGYRFRMETVEDVRVNGQVVIPAGSLAAGEITEVRNKGMWGKSGKFAGRVLYVVANGRQIRMTGRMDDKGTAGGVGAVAVSALVFLPAGFFMTGTSASLPIGAPVQGFIDEDVALAFPPAAAPMVAVAAAPVAQPAPVAPAPAVVTQVAYAPQPAPQPAVVFVAAPVAPVTQVAAVAPAAMPISAMSPSVKRYAQRDEYIRMVQQLGTPPAVAMAAVEKKYGIPME